MENSPILTTANGKHVVIDAGKGGIVVAVDQSTGKLLWKTPVGKHNGHDQDGLLTLAATSPKLKSPRTLVYPGILGRRRVAARLRRHERLRGRQQPGLDLHEQHRGRDQARRLHQGHRRHRRAQPGHGQDRLGSQLHPVALRRRERDHDVLFTTTFDGTVWAFSTKTGKTLWSARPANRSRRRPRPQPCPRTRGVGRPDRRDRGPRVLGHRRRGRRGVTGWAVGDRVVGGPVAACGECEYCLAGRPSLCVERGPGRRTTSDVAGRVRRLQGDRARPSAARARRPLAQHAALTEPLAVALHGITQAGGARPGHALARHRRRPDRVPVGRGAEGARRRRHRGERAARRAGASCARSSARATVDARRARHAAHRRTTSSTSRSTSRSSARATAAAMEQCARAARSAPARSCSSARASAPPQFDPNRILLNELVITGAFVLRRRRLRPRARAARVGQVPERPARRAGRRSAERAARRPALGLHEGDPRRRR